MDDNYTFEDFTNEFRWRHWDEIPKDKHDALPAE